MLQTLDSLNAVVNATKLIAKPSERSSFWVRQTVKSFWVFLIFKALQFALRFGTQNV